MIKVAILGYGGIARSHRLGYEHLAEIGAPVELVALCDVDPSQFTSSRDYVVKDGVKTKTWAKEYRTYTDLETMLAEEELDTIDICLPTYLHCQYAINLLERGYNVQSEKPMGRNQQECKAMIEAAQKSGKKLMIGMCLRFDNLYLALKEAIDDGRFGKVESAHFERLNSLPRFGYDNWYWDYDRSGGVALDMHIHDVDMIRFLFGEPKAVSALTTDCKVRCTTINSNFIYDDKLVSAIGDWGQSPSLGFLNTYHVNFEHATLTMDGEKIRIYPEEGEPYDLEYTANDHMAAESEYFAHYVLGEIQNDRNTLNSAAQTVALIDKLMESAENGGKTVEV